MITADQLIAHAVGDYILQSHWMANHKTKKHLAALVHALVYSLVFLVFRPSPAAWLVIFGSHFLIDRYRLARYVVWAKNFLAPIDLRQMYRAWTGCNHPVGDLLYAPEMSAYRCRCGVYMEARDLRLFGQGVRERATFNPPWSKCSATGYPEDAPAWLSVWLLVIADNILHVLINGACLRWL